MDDASRSPSYEEELQTSYEEELQTFRVVLRHILERGELLPACLDFDLELIQALGDVLRAVRDGSRTGDLVRDAYRAFAEYAFRNEGIVQQQASKRA